jgi:hypothetical protein
VNRTRRETLVESIKALADPMPGPYIATSLGDGLAAGAGETKVFRVAKEKEVKNFLLLQPVPNSLRAPIESSETIRRVASLLSSDGFLRLRKFRFPVSRNG